MTVGYIGLGAMLGQKREERDHPVPPSPRLGSEAEYTGNETQNETD